MIGIARNYASSTPFTAYGAFATPASASAEGDPGSLTTNIVTVNGVGGVEPYTYSWMKLSGDDVTVSSSTSSVVTFSASGSNGDEKEANYRCTVTDDALATVTVDVSSFFLFGTIL